MAVWEIISTIFKSHTSWTIVRPCQKTKDGRNAYLRLYAHHLGPSAVDIMSSAAEKALKIVVIRVSLKNGTLISMFAYKWSNIGYFLTSRSMAIQV